MHRLGIVALLTALGFPGELSAQVVAGRVVTTTTGRTLAGTAVVLVDDSAAIVDRGRTDAEGVFALRAPSAGRYRVVFFVADGGSFATPTIELAAGDYLEREFAVAEIPAALRDVFFAADVDRPAVYAPDNPVPRYPTTQRNRGERGLVSAMFVVDTAGHVEMSTFQVVNEPHRAFADAVRRILPRWTFDPALRAGAPARQVVQLSFDFGMLGDPPAGDIIIRAMGVTRRSVIRIPDPGPR